MAQTIQLFGAIAVRPAVPPLLVDFEARSGFTVAARWELNPAVKQQIDEGAKFDLVITNPQPIDELIASDKVMGGSKVVFGRIAMGVATQAGNTIGPVENGEDFRELMKEARSIAYASEGTSGAYFRSLLERLDLSDVLSKLVPVSGGQTAAAVGRGEAEIGVIPVTSIIAAGPDAVLVSKFPREFQSYIEFAIGIAEGAINREGAEQLLSYLASPSLDALLSARGLDRYLT